ncbi:MAG: cytochrome c biogenesis protein CcsA [Micromonosporaceae bacterium]|jgi:heme exporter protein C|nr:cytochrome c biogenesis protein CcsA [Micromonosporaceae bacterium]
MAGDRPAHLDRGPAAAGRRNLGWFAAGVGGAGLVSGLFVAPPDAVQGDAARLMYLHVPAAWTAYLAYAVVLVASAAYLGRRDLRFDRYAQAAAEIGVGMTALTIAIGGIWGRAVWGVWWAWDPRVVSTALLLVVYAAHLAVRRMDADPHRGARRAAVLGIAGFAMLPVVHFSVVWWRSLHQPATVLGPSTDPPIDPVMLATLTLCLGAFIATASWLFLHRVQSLRAAGQEPRRDAAGRHRVPARSAR